MITVISGTNRLGSNTRKVALNYYSMLENQGHNVQFLDLEWLKSVERDEHFNMIEREILIPTKKFVVIVPEYNGSFPGVFKLLIDLCDIKKVWHGKKAMIVGVSDGRAGNLRGIDTLTNIFNYMKMQVLPNKIPLSKINTELDENDAFAHQHTLVAIENQISEFIDF